MPTARDRLSLVRSRLIDRIVRVDLRVRDVDRSVAFYAGVVGLEVAERTETVAAMRGPGGAPILTLDARGVTDPADPGATGLFHTAIRFPTRASLGDALARLVDARLEVGAGDHLVSEALYVDDPDGNGVELYWDRPVDEWPPPADGMMVPMATLHVDLQSLLAEGAGAAAVGARAPGGTDVGHVHLQVSDVDRTTRFLVEVIGLDLTGSLGGQAAFFSSNGYHHHVGANSWRSRGGRAAPRSRAGLERVVFAATDAGELEALRARLGRGGDATDEADGGVVVRDPDGIALGFVSG